MAITDDPSKAAAPEPSENGLGTMTLFEHLSELRKRLLICILAVVVTTTVAWFFYDQLLHFMRNPYCDFVHHHKGKSISGCNLVTTGPLEGFTTRIKVSAYAGIALAAPVWLWQLWKFITPGLYKNEKRYIVPFVAGAIALFALGVTTAVLVFPKALNWLIDVSGSGVVPLFSPSKYFTLYMAMGVIFGLVFMYPLVVVFLEIVGVVPSKTWRRWRRVAIVVICAVAAVITPSSDPFSFLAMAVPMLLFYEGSILLGRVMGK
jgi:sec-independent protein translocase protein TatC